MPGASYSVYCSISVFEKCPQLTRGCPGYIAAAGAPAWVDVTWTVEALPGRTTQRLLPQVGPAVEPVSDRHYRGEPDLAVHDSPHLAALERPAPDDGLPSPRVELDLDGKSRLTVPVVHRDHTPSNARDLASGEPRTDHGRGAPARVIRVVRANHSSAALAVDEPGEAVDPLPRRKHLVHLVRARGQSQRGRGGLPIGDLATIPELCPVRGELRVEVDQVTRRQRPTSGIGGVRE